MSSYSKKNGKGVSAHEQIGEVSSRILRRHKSIEEIENGEKLIYGIPYEVMKERLLRRWKIIKEHKKRAYKIMPRHENIMEKKEVYEKESN